jgi:hypothetical protein
VTRYGCQRGVSFEGCETRCGKSPLRRPCFGRPDANGPETQRTPGSAAGCNKPATPKAEKTVEVVQNHEDGTGFEAGCLEPKPDQQWSSGSGRQRSTSMEGPGSQRCDQASREPEDRAGNRSLRRSHLEIRTAASGTVFHRAEPSRATHGDSNREVRRGSRRPVSTGALRNRRHPSKTRTATCKVTEGAAKATELHRPSRRKPSPIQKMSLVPGP